MPEKPRHFLAPENRNVNKLISAFMSLHLLGMNSVPNPVCSISGRIANSSLRYCTNFLANEVETLRGHLLDWERTRSWLLSDSPSTLNFPLVQQEGNLLQM